MAVVFRLVVTQFGVIGSSGSITSASFTATAADTILSFGTAENATGPTLSWTGTGSYSLNTTQWTDTTGASYNAAQNANATAGAQTITITQSSGAGGNQDGWGIEYSGVGVIGTAVHNQRNTPGAGAGAITGTSVNVPTGSVLVALCVDISGTASNSIVNTAGTSRQNGNCAGGDGSYRFVEYAGAGSNITPAFTDASNGAVDNYMVIQVLLSPVGTGGYDDAELWAGSFFDEAVSTFHADSYQNRNLDPQIDDPWIHWHEQDIDDELIFAVFDSEANRGQVFQQPWDWYPEWTSADDTADEWESWQDDSVGNAGQVFQQPEEWKQDWDDDTADEWESWYVESAANPGFVDIPPPDGWYDPDDTADEWDLWQADSAANPGFVDLPPPDGWYDPDDTADEWESWQDDSTANSGFVDVPPADPWDFAYDDIDDEWWVEDRPQEPVVAGQPVEDPWWWDEDVGDEWESVQEDLTNTGFVDVPAADPWDWIFDDIEDEFAADEYALEDFQAADQPPEDAWPWSGDETDDELPAEEVLGESLPADQPPDDPFVEDDAGDDWWVDDYQLVDNNPVLSLEDAWDQFVDLDVDDPWEAWQFDSGVGPDNNPVIAPQIDVWDDEVDDEWLVEDRAQDQVTAITVEDAWWPDDDPGDDWEWWLDAATSADFTAPAAADDGFVFDDDTADEWDWWLDAVTPPDVAPPPPAALQPTDIKVQRPSRRNIRFKWGFQPAIEAETPPRQASEAPRPSKLLQGLLGRLGTGIEERREPPEIPPEPAARPPELKPVLAEVPRETAARRRRRRLALVEPRRQERARQVAEDERLVEEGHAAHLRRVEREAKRRARLAVVERGRLKRIEEIEKRVEAIGEIFAQVQRKLDTARRQRERLDALHKHLSRSAQEGDVRRMTGRVQQVRAAEAELRRIHAELLQLSEGIGGDLGHDQEVVQLEQDLRRAYHEEAERVEREMMRSRNNLIAVQTAVRLLLGWRSPWDDPDDSE